MTAWYLGVDGGQSSTTAVIGDEHGTVLGIGRGGPCNHVSAAEARDRFMNAIRGALQEAIAEAMSRARDTVLRVDEHITFEAACLGLSGGPADKQALSRELIRADRYKFTHDAEIALTGALGGGPGIIVIAGTGSMAFGRDAAGKTARAGGWGYIFGDEGGAFDIVRQALRAILRWEEGWGPSTALREHLLQATQAPDANTLLHRCYTPEFPRAKVASYAAIVDQVAAGGDAVAREILMREAQALASFAGAVKGQLFADAEAGEKAARVSYFGGVFESKLLLERFTMLAELTGDATVQAPQYNAASGALIEAYRLAGLHVSGLHVSELDKSGLEIHPATHE